ncbi:3-oxoacyl-ACP synthase [Burkholderia vietnamiensis]|uniref:3-oxoacyl-ACP synthase n=1 Tax=Burkholderia vietnamiensis TaxID=60552 RepID=UPI0015930D51|nr:3-oxoacyl-ACP synthase [Burkholderia vietnamiensis]MBR8034381.1 3-oxoacyl-ACP synthase [Burkholderia vietnamiensis]MCA8270158.1 3-oxoacyl-ACP synthase [Burkholderia vietnamiensis]MDN8039290.1 3-oxoacyl-ACP synthase [Burkholderia vietnamiensis]WHU96486.1 3-oxoacyl-ACP synthase [Burkholderia vietnamiensis]HDR8928010.1 3-oxoacyl-ACP synthase [Burkholderia vietnamiensis]
MSASIGIVHTAYYLPEPAEDVRGWAQRTKQSVETVKRLEKAGVRLFYNARGQTALSLAANAIQSLVCATRLGPDTIDFLVYVHTLQGSVAPPPLSLPRLLCEHFGFERAEAFSFAQQHCASSLGALRIIRAMFAARPAINRGLLVGADVMPLASERSIAGAGLLSDGACAVLVERDASINRLVSLAFHASGEGWRGTLEQDESRFASQYFFAARRLAMQASAEANVPLAEIQRILPCHLDLPTWRRTVASLGLPARHLFADNFVRIAHVTVCDPFINLADCGDLVPGKPFLLCARGVGGFSAAALFVR